MWLVLLGAVLSLVLINRVWLALRERRFPQAAAVVHVDFGLIRVLKNTFKSRRAGVLPYYFRDRFDAHNADTIRVGLLTKPVITRDPENIKAILATQFHDFCLGKRRPQFAPLLGDGIFTLDGVGWKHSRAMLTPQFTRDQVSHVELIESHLQWFIKHVENGETDLQPLFFKMTMDVATEFLFGELIECLRDASVGYDVTLSVPGRSDFARAFDLSQEVLFTRLVIQKYYWVINPSRFRDANRVAHKLADHYVERVLGMSEEEVEALKGYTFLVELAKQTRDPQVLRDQALNILLAGRDTTASLLLFIFYELAKHPEVTEKLREEIADHFGDDNSNITFELLKKCLYLQSVINETLRLFPIVPFNIREVTRDTTLPRGGGPKGDKPVFVAKNELVIYNVFAMQRNKNIYGKDANEFRPERWQGGLPLKLGWAYLPFNGGPRICLGQQFALTEAAYVTVRLLQRFSTLVDHNDDRCRLCTKLTMSLLDGCKVSMS